MGATFSMNLAARVLPPCDTDTALDGWLQLGVRVLSERCDPCILCISSVCFSQILSKNLTTVYSNSVKNMKNWQP